MSIEAQRTKSGKWSALGYYQDQDGIHRKRFTAEKKKDAERMAAEWSADNQINQYAPITFYTACREFIDKKSNILSPSTITGYEGILQRYLGIIYKKQINEITNKCLQELMNNLAVKLSPKTIRNIYGFISAVLSECRPDLALKVSLPKSKKKKIHVPTTQEMKIIFEKCIGTRWESPVLCSAIGSLRRSEICALRISDIGEGSITIDKALVDDKEGNHLLKTTKSDAGNRITYVPKEVTDRIIANATADGRITEMSPAALSNGWYHFLKHCGIEPFPFHSLRRFYASYMHLNGVPDKYIMRLGGWGNEGTLHRSYESVLEDQFSEVVADSVKNFSKLL